VVVIELLAGVILGPHVLGVHVDDVISFFSDLGLALLFFFAEGVAVAQTPDLVRR